MAELREVLNRYQIKIEPKFNGEFIRNGAQWFKGMSWHFKGKDYKRAFFGDFSEDLSLSWQSWSDNIHDPIFSEEISKANREAAQAEEEARIRIQQLAAEKATAIWAKCTEEGDLPDYLKKKGIKGLFGARLKSNEDLIVPGLDYDAKIWNLQIIHKPLQDGRTKSFLKGARVSGLFFTLYSGSISKQVDQIFICEGFATAATVQMALGPSALVICAFTAGNLKFVGQTIRSKFPGSLIFFCADDDGLKQNGAEK